jgi:hypothetical protein
MTMTALSHREHPPGLARLSTRHRAIVAQAFRYLGALAVLATGVAHIEQQPVDNYSTVPTIGTLFLLNFIAAIVVAIAVEVAATKFLFAFLVAKGTGLPKIRTRAR